MRMTECNEASVVLVMKKVVEPRISHRNLRAHNEKMGMA
jgi:hypothetical protein